MKSGVIDSLVVQNPFKMGYEGVKTMVDHLSGKTPPRRIDSGAVLVKVEDLDKPDIKKLLNPDLKF